ncbi:MAG: preprotein translocase subunit SecG [Candidatus Omnitrophica bacterium]|nr:preprotein translocase subunit SecG [Candidatus Omnitrophota bacterium]
MYIALLIVHVIVSLFLIFIILLQSGKGEGLSDAFGGGSSQTTIFGSRAGTFLTKATTASAIIFMVTCLGLALVSRQKSGSVIERELLKEQIVEKVKEVVKTEGTEQKQEASQLPESGAASAEMPE